MSSSWKYSHSSPELRSAADEHRFITDHEYFKRGVERWRRKAYQSIRYLVQGYNGRVVYGEDSEDRIKAFTEALLRAYNAGLHDAREAIPEAIAPMADR